MNNAELINSLKDAEKYMDYVATVCYASREAIKAIRAAADALESAEKRIAELESNNPIVESVLVDKLNQWIAELEIETERLKSSNDELRERQTYIDHWGNKWMTSCEDVPTATYNHGFLDGEQAVSGDLRSVRKGEQE